MKILALEFSSPQRSVAVVDTAQGAPIAGPAPLETEVIASGVLGPGPLGMLDAVLRAAHLEREQIECLAVGLGPGSYAGIRAAIALAQGWQLARSVQLLGISSAEAIAAEAQAGGVVGPVAVVIDAQRDEFYLANYELSPGGWRECQPLRLAAPAEVQAAGQAGLLLIGPDLAAGFPSGRVTLPRATTVGRLARGRTNFIPGEKLEPIYLRETKFVKAPPPRMLPP